MGRLSGIEDIIFFFLHFWLFAAGLRIRVFWLDPDPGVLVRSGYKCFGRIRIQEFWSDPDPSVLDKN